MFIIIGGYSRLPPSCNERAFYAIKKSLRCDVTQTTPRDEADFCLPNSGNSPIIKNMSIRTHLYRVIPRLLVPFRNICNSSARRWTRWSGACSAMSIDSITNCRESSCTRWIKTNSPRRFRPPSKSLATVYSTRSCRKISSATLSATAGWRKVSNSYNIFTCIISALPPACAGSRVTDFDKGTYPNV